MYKGKAIYNPSGKAGEYSYWACNFYVGCSNGCTYCYCKKGLLKAVMGSDEPTLKKCFLHEGQALDIFEKEIKQNLSDLRKYGIFFSFTTDPCLPETWPLTCEAINICRKYDVPFKVLTKRTDWEIEDFIREYQTTGYIWQRTAKKHLWAFGCTLTGADELEPYANTNAERIAAIIKLHDAGFKTFISIEPIISFELAKTMIKASVGYCDLYKIGLMSGKKYNQEEAGYFVKWLSELSEQPKIYLKESLLKLSRYESHELGKNFVSRDYNIWNKV